jgi:hypothetical protein
VPISSFCLLEKHEAALVQRGLDTIRWCAAYGRLLNRPNSVTSQPDLLNILVIVTLMTTTPVEDVGLLGDTLTPESALLL